MPRLTAGIVLGLGLGGFVDGIALHQIAQWHSMGSARLPATSMDAMRLNIVWGRPLGDVDPDLIGV
jgi:uncharacterized membrane protein